MLRKVLVIVGTTGAGKTKLSIDLAKAVGGEIINSDAMQMYRGLDIATAKVTEEEKEGIPHHLFDVMSPSERCDVNEFKRLALLKIEEIFSRGKIPIIVGGTMYYTQSILWKSQLLDDIPIVNTNTNDMSTLSAEEMYDKLKQVDPIMASRLHPNNIRKIQRSLEVFEQTGIPHSELIKQQEEQKTQEEKLFDACGFWVHCEKEVLITRLSKRVEQMIASGLVEEIKNLRAQIKTNLSPHFVEYPKEDPQNHPIGILQAIGYKEFQPYFDAFDKNQEQTIQEKEKLDQIFQECIVQLNIATRQYARRQLTWIRNRFVTRNIPVYQVDSSDVTQWKKKVLTPCISIATKFLNDQKDQEQEESFYKYQVNQTKQIDPLIEKFCDICGHRKFIGNKQWEAHLKSKKHKFHLKRIELEKKQ